LALRQEELTSLCDDVDLERDRALVERSQAGDSAAFGNLYSRYYERLVRFCLRRLNDRHEAEDAAQEAFARAWKALPSFAGKRRFYPWLTVIAANICTDVLRRRSRSTPTDDLALTVQHPVGVVGSDTSEELVLAAVDGELVNRAFGRLSARHRHVLAMREGSGWTYQQIADHEGVEVGTIETLLWRARQALKREFAVVSQSKEALAGFLVAGAALFRRIIFRVAHRSASMHSQNGNSGGLRNAVAGVAVTGAAVAAALITPHALSSGPSHTRTSVVSSGAAAAGRPLPITTPAPTAGATGNGPGSRNGPGSGGPTADGGRGSSGAGGSSRGSLLGGSGSGVVGGVTGGLSGATGALQNGVDNTVSGLGGAVSGVTSGLGGALGGGNASNPVSGAVSGLNGAVSGVLGGVTGSGGITYTPSSGSGSSGSSSGATTTTTTTTNPNLVGGLTKTAGGLLGG
jgi:RNA polymerase sigma-70 factor (ECF subfamily)